MAHHHRYRRVVTPPPSLHYSDVLSLRDFISERYLDSLLDIESDSFCTDEFPVEKTEIIFDHDTGNSSVTRKFKDGTTEMVCTVGGLLQHGDPYSPPT